MNKTKITLIAAGLAFLGLSGAVLSQSVNAPQVTIINPTDLIQIVPFGQPRAQSVYTTPSLLTAQKGSYKSAPASGFTFTFANNQALAAFDPAGTLAYGYVTLAPLPSDQTEECIFSTEAITTLYLSANSNQTLSDGVSTLAANARVCYSYSLSNATWNRSQ